MEASRFGFDLPPAYKFDPTDVDIVAYYLLPRAVGFPNPYAHAIIDADPCSCPPWEFMRRHGHADSDHGFFFAPPRDADPKKRATRAVAPGEDGVGGTWDGQRSDVTRLVLLRGRDGGPGAARVEVTYKRNNLSYYHGPQKKRTSGWVMHDYQIVEPPHLSGTVLSRVKITDRTKKEQGKRKADAGQQELQVVLPGPDQPGPSNYYDHAGDENGSVMWETAETGGHYYADDGSYYFNEGFGCYLDEGHGNDGDCFTAGDDDDGYANGVFMGETGGYHVDGSNSYLNQQDSGCYMDHGDGGGGDYYFNVGDNNSYDYVHPDDGGGGDYYFNVGDNKHPDDGNGG